MKIKRISSIGLFDPERVVTSAEIFTRKTEIFDEGGVIFEGKTFDDNGLFSKRIFGSLNSDDEYACECGKFIGKLYEGLKCDKCNSEVKVVQANIDKVGWIDLKGHYIIKYVSYSMLEKVIGRDNLKNIVHLPNKITMEGNIDEEEVKTIQSISPAHKYWHIGLKKFRQNYKEVLDYYFHLNGDKNKDLYEFLEDIDDVFTDKIPVISIVLRPAMRTVDGLKLDELNNIYINILKNNEILLDTINTTEIIRDVTIEIIQAEYFMLSGKIMENIKSKSGLIRNQIMGSRLNFSARNIIGPAEAGYKMDEIVLPYLTFLNLYKFEIINILTRIKSIGYYEAENIWYKATLKKDEEIYKIMKKMISEEEIGILLNRNPTISYGSILYLQVAGIKSDYEDLTASINNLLLSLLSGDYDKEKNRKTEKQLFKEPE